MPSHYVNQCRIIVNWILRNKFQWNLNRNSYIVIHENEFDYVVWKTAAILSRPECVNNDVCGVHNKIWLAWGLAETSIWITSVFMSKRVILIRCVIKQGHGRRKTDQPFLYQMQWSLNWYFIALVWPFWGHPLSINVYGTFSLSASYCCESKCHHWNYVCYVLVSLCRKWV